LSFFEVEDRHFRSFEVEDCIKLSRFLRIYPRKTLKFKVRMRSKVLEVFEDSSKFLEKYSLRGHS